MGMDTNRIRGSIILIFMGLVIAIMVGRLFTIQILSKEYRGMADRRVKSHKVIIPPRGNIYDRNKEIYVKNSPLFDLRVTPKNLEIPDTNLLCQYLEMDKKDVRKRIYQASRFNPYKEYILAQYIEPENYSVLQEMTWNFEGISFNMTNKRYYEHPVGANFLGYIGEVDSSDIRRASPDTYATGDMIGKSGIERSYDTLLRGKPGKQIVLKDVFGREVGPFMGGSSDIPATRGKDIYLGVDTELQRLGEALMHNKRGSIVAIEPYTGEILAFVSAPTYNPNDLTGHDLRRNWRKLRQDTLNPLFNRALMATYQPGSIFKLPLALAALNEGVITPETAYSCGGGFWRNRGKPGCRLHPHPLRLKNAISYSCNSYFAATFVDFVNHKQYQDLYEGYNTFYEYMADMGIGQKLHVDLPYEQTGNLPSTRMYDNERRWYGKNKWNALTVISNSIGQGELLLTPLQMANLSVLMANRGFYVTPHFVRGTRAANDTSIQPLSFAKKELPIKREHFEVIIDAMEYAVKYGTAYRAFIHNSIRVCGKTGTVENNMGEDHSVFLGFAPRENPRIAIAVIIENAGGGGLWAAPLAGVMMEQYLTGEVVHKQYELQRLIKTDFLRTY